MEMWGGLPSIVEACVYFQHHNLQSFVTLLQCMEKWGGLPDIVMACVGGGSNAMGIFNEFVEEPTVRLIGVEVSVHAQAFCHLAPTPFGHLQ